MNINNLQSLQKLPQNLQRHVICHVTHVIRIILDLSVRWIRVRSQQGTYIQFLSWVDRFSETTFPTMC